MKNKKTLKKNLIAALNNLFTQSQGVKGWNTNHIPKSLNGVDHKALKVKAIAFYLPQFHPIPENDSWWGKGFTEWTNVTKAVPQFLGHHQPHLPGELGFYDLRLKESIEQQALLARHYGIYGFCFHHYWFGGKALLEKPLQLLLENKTIDINFLICWANEGWTRKWDGLENDVLISQHHSISDDEKFFESIIPAMSDSRYIKIDGKPILIVYRITLFPDPKATAKLWRSMALKAGFSGIYLIVARSFNIDDPRDYDFDAAVEFPPHKLLALEEINNKVEILNPDYSGKIFDYGEAVNQSINFKFKDYRCFRTVMPSWDNEARRPGNGFSFVNSTPINYGKWLNWVCRETIKNPEEERLVFINAWNEWAEGAHLEPDRKMGYAYLHTTANVLKKFYKNDSFIKKCEQKNKKFQKKSNTAVILHLYYPELLPGILQRIDQLDNVDLFVTVPNYISEGILDKLDGYKNSVKLVVVENQGRDIRPFLVALKEEIVPLGYEYLIKIHTKKSLHRVDGDQWRDSLLDSLINIENFNNFKLDSEQFMCGPSGSLTDLSVKEIHAGNIEWLNSLLENFGREDMIGEYNFKFISGSMFYMRLGLCKNLNILFNLLDSFELEAGQLDGTLAHAVERVFSMVGAEKFDSIRELT
jgi:lipopolysaccharide biosynthesis protein